MTVHYFQDFATEPEAHSFAEGLQRANKGDLNDILVMIPFDDRPYVIWSDEAPQTIVRNVVTHHETPDPD